MFEKGTVKNFQLCLLFWRLLKSCNTCSTIRAQDIIFKRKSEKIMKKELIFLGPPACGKGTQTDKLAKHLNFPHIDTGSLLRAEIKNDTPVFGFIYESSFFLPWCVQLKCFFVLLVCLSLFIFPIKKAVSLIFSIFFLGSISFISA